MTENFSEATREAVDKRFHAISLDHPINALLYNLALKKEEQRSEIADFSTNATPAIPNVEEYMDLRKKMSLLPLDTIQERIKLPTVPAAVLQLQQAIEEQAPVEEMAKIILVDPKLTTSIMSMVNSALYSLPCKVETLSRALTVIGTQQISILALATRLLSMFEDTDPQGLPVMSFWKHSIACAVLAHGIAIICRRPEPEKYLVAGLLHDLGRVILFSQYPEIAKAAFAIQSVRGISLQKAEEWLFDVDHAMIGALFFSEWNMPDGIKLSALYHHNPQMCIGKDIPEVVYVANQLANALRIGCNIYYTLEPGEAIWERLKIDEEALVTLVETVDERLWALFCSLFPTSPECHQR